jgi:hypothetical protein
MSNDWINGRLNDSDWPSEWLNECFREWMTRWIVTCCMKYLICGWFLDDLFDWQTDWMIGSNEYVTQSGESYQWMNEWATTPSWLA